MIRSHASVATGLLFVLAFAGSGQAAFNASDQVFIPIAAHNEGIADSLWRTDIHITNVDETDVDVAIAFLPAGLINNSYIFSSRSYFLGGREDEGFGKVDPVLADIAPGATVVLADILQAHFEEELPITGTGGLVFFAYEAGTLDATDGRVLRSIIVASRTYNETFHWIEDPDNEGEFIQEAITYGQGIPGVPWYQLGDGGTNTVHGDFSYQTLNISAVDPAMRFNVGILNSSDPQTSVTFEIKPFDLAGEPFLREDETEISMVAILPPLAQMQYTNILRGGFGLGDEDQVGTVVVRVLQWNTNSVDPRPRFTIYGSLVDNRSNDSTTVLPSFDAPFNIDCIWEPVTDPKVAGVDAERRVETRSLDIPER